MVQMNSQDLGQGDAIVGIHGFWPSIYTKVLKPLQINLVSTRRTISCFAHLRCLERGCLKWPQSGYQKSLKVTSKNFDLPIWCINCQVCLHFSSSAGAESTGEQKTTLRCSLWQISASTGIAMSIEI